MKTAFILGALLAALASRQEPAEETAADLDKHVEESLQTKVAVAGGLTLPMMFYMLAVNGDVDLHCYVDPIALPKIDDLKTKFLGEVPLTEVLAAILKPKSLVHMAWQGILVITDEKGRKALVEGEGSGLTPKALAGHSELSKKLDKVYTFAWNAVEPQEALKEFAKQSGVSIESAALKGLELKIEQRGMLSPKKTTLRGALGCLARTTGITYEITKDGGLVAKKPAKK